MLSSGESTPPTVWELRLEPSVYLFKLVWEVVPGCTGRYEDRVLLFEANYRWNVVCNVWYGFLICKPVEPVLQAAALQGPSAVADAQLLASRSRG